MSVPGVVEGADAVRRGERTAAALVAESLDAIGDDPLRAFLCVDRDGALAAAEAVDAAVARGDDPGPLAGVPVAVKDNLVTADLPTTCASRMLDGYRSPFDATVVGRLRSAGAVIVGKTNLDEFAMGSSTETSAFGPARNPHDPARSPGGSSGGSAAATAAGLVAGALGSDTGGSVRQPAAFCGVTAIKPTYGRVSRYGLVAFASSLDQVGPIARSVVDAARLLGVIAGRDPRDPTTVARDVDDCEAGLRDPVAGLRIGRLDEDLDACEDPEVAAGVRRAADALADAGCEIVPARLPHARYALSAYYLIAPAEASSNLARFDGVRYGHRVAGSDLAQTYERTRAAGFGPEVRRRIMLGTFALSAGYYDAYYSKAQRVRTLIRRDFDHALGACDALLGPTAPTPAFPLGDKVGDPLAMYLADVFTLPASLAGLPAVATPCGVGRAGLPLGVQLSGRAFEEATVLRLAAVVERACGGAPPAVGVAS